MLLALLFTGVFSMTVNAETPKTETAVFAGGCFWCMHAEYEKLPGVSRVLSGYTGGEVANPAYDQVSSGTTGHVEAVEIVFDPLKTNYAKLLDIFWSNIDPTDPDGQFCDQGSQYAAGIFYLSEAQKAEAEKSIADVEKKLNIKVAAFLKPAKPFYAAEEYHQSYYKKNEIRYKMYKMGCGRDQTLKKVWGEK